MRHFIVILAIVFSANLVAQQGNNFSLWYLNNLQHNPGAVGAIDNNFKVFANYRNQYLTLTSHPFQTISASAEGKLFQSRRYRHYMGFGGSFVNDMSGDGKYTVNDIKVPLAFHIFFDDDNSLSIGIAPGIYQRSISLDKFNWESQWNGREFDESLPSYENYANTSLTKFDMGAGIYFNRNPSPNQNFYAGFSVNHILQPPLDFKIMDDLFMRYTGHIGGRYRLSQSMIGISPHIITMFQGPNQDIIFGSNIDFYLGSHSQRTSFTSQSRLSVGLFHRFKDALILNVQYAIEGLTIAAAYDANLAMMRHSKGVGAFEVAVMYDVSFDKRRRFIF